MSKATTSTGTPPEQLAETVSNANVRRATIREEKLRQKTLGQLTPAQRHAVLVKEIMDQFQGKNFSVAQGYSFLCKYFNVVDLTLIRDDLKNG